MTTKLIDEKLFLNRTIARLDTKAVNCTVFYFTDESAAELETAHVGHNIYGIVSAPIKPLDRKIEPVPKESKESIKSLTAKINELRKALKTDADQLFAEHLKEHLPAVLVGFQWTQYTSYFNDGEPCTFGVQADYPNVKFVDHEDFVGWDDFEYGPKLTKPEGFEAAQSFIKEFAKIPKDIFEAAFGDHAQITVERTKKGGVSVKVAKYTDHD